jgi:hypothetical protein
MMSRLNLTGCMNMSGIDIKEIRKNKLKSLDSDEK